MSVFEEIKTSVTSRDVAKFYGLEINPEFATLLLKQF